MVLTHSPELIGEALFESADSQALPIEEEGFGGKLDRISRIIGLQLENAVFGAKLAHGSGESVGGDNDGVADASAGLRAVFNSKSPENAFSLAESAVYANDRVIATLVRHLVEHVVIDHELRAMAADARRRAADDLRDIPSTMVDFVNRLMASGVVVDDVRNMSKARLALLVSAIKDLGNQEALDSIPDDLPASTWSDDADAVLKVDNASVESEFGGGIWDVIDVSNTGYRIEQSSIIAAEDAAVALMRFPTDRSMLRLAAPTGIEQTLANGAEIKHDKDLAQRFVGRFCSRTGLSLTEEERRLWLFLLFEVNTASVEKQIGRNGFFDGVRLPAEKGSSQIRRLVAVDRERLSDTVDDVVLSAPATQRR